MPSLADRFLQTYIDKNIRLNGPAMVLVLAMLYNFKNPPLEYVNELSLLPGFSDLVSVLDSYLYLD